MPAVAGRNDPDRTGGHHGAPAGMGLRATGRAVHRRLRGRQRSRAPAFRRQWRRARQRHAHADGAGMGHAHRPRLRPAGPFTDAADAARAGVAWPGRQSGRGRRPGAGRAQCLGGGRRNAGFHRHRPGRVRCRRQRSCRMFRTSRATTPLSPPRSPTPSRPGTSIARDGSAGVSRPAVTSSTTSAQPLQHAGDDRPLRRPCGQRRRAGRSRLQRHVGRAMRRARGGRVTANPGRFPCRHLGPAVRPDLADSERFLAAGWQEGVNLWFTPFPGGHTYASVQLEQIWTNLCPFQVLP